MELWLWIVNGVMWLIAVGLIGAGIWKIFECIAKSSAAERNITVKWLTQQRDEILAECRGMDKQLAGWRAERFKDVVEVLSELVEQGGEESDLGRISEIRATKDMALAAAFFAMASVVVGISAVLIVVF